MEDKTMGSWAEMSLPQWQDKLIKRLKIWLNNQNNVSIMQDILSIYLFQKSNIFANLFL